MLVCLGNSSNSSEKIFGCEDFKVIGLQNEKFVSGLTYFDDSFSLSELSFILSLSHPKSFFFSVEFSERGCTPPLSYAQDKQMSEMSIFEYKYLYFFILQSY